MIKQVIALQCSTHIAQRTRFACLSNSEVFTLKSSVLVSIPSIKVPLSRSFSNIKNNFVEK